MDMTEPKPRQKIFETWFEGLFVFLPLDMSSVNISVPANNLGTRSLIVIYDNYMISFLCFV